MISWFRLAFVTNQFCFPQRRTAFQSLLLELAPIEGLKFSSQSCLWSFFPKVLKSLNFRSLESCCGPFCWGENKIFEDQILKIFLFSKTSIFLRHLRNTVKHSWFSEKWCAYQSDFIVTQFGVFHQINL